MRTTSHGACENRLPRSCRARHLVVAEIDAREVRKLDLTEALELTALVALRDREHSRRFAVRWLQRWLEESKTPTIEDATMVAACLAALGGQRHTDALTSLWTVLVRPRELRNTG